MANLHRPHGLQWRLAGYHHLHRNVRNFQFTYFLRMAPVIVDCVFVFLTSRCPACMPFLDWCLVYLLQFCRFFAAAAFAWSFPPREYMTGEPPGFWRSVYSLFDLTDVVDDVQGMCMAKITRFIQKSALKSHSRSHGLNL